MGSSVDRGIGGHQRAYRGATDSWVTPKHIIDELGPFDLDPCAADPQPWPCAIRSYTESDDGLRQLWCGRVWCNPPYGPQTSRWLSRLAAHGNGIALTFARTETRMFFEQVWEKASALLFIRDRLYFYYPDGSRAEGNSGGPSVLIAYGQYNANRLLECKIPGAHVQGWRAT